jgi:hypothetical protein
MMQDFDYIARATKVAGVHYFNEFEHSSAELVDCDDMFMIEL